MSYTTPDICDQYSAELQILEPLFTGFGGKDKFCGEVVTIKCFEDNSMVKKTLGSVGRGKVLVVDGGGSLRCALLGDLLGALALQNGWSGLVINGCVRDIEILKSINIGVLALKSYPLKSNKRDEGQVNVPVRFAGVNFLPGGYLYADENGVVVSRANLNLE